MLARFVSRQGLDLVIVAILFSEQQTGWKVPQVFTCNDDVWLLFRAGPQELDCIGVVHSSQDVQLCSEVSQCDCTGVLDYLCSYQCIVPFGLMHNTKFALPCQEEGSIIERTLAKKRLNFNLIPNLSRIAGCFLGGELRHTPVCHICLMQFADTQSIAASQSLNDHQQALI